MPIYEYRCPDCSHEFEEIQKMSADPVTLCPTCGKENVTKLLSAAAFHLKGGGWANDNYGLKSGGGDSGGGDSGGGDSGSDASAPSVSEAPASGKSSAPAKESSPAPAPAATPAPSSSGGSSSGGE
jgi:putative FmdB family regulatory protein